MYIFYEFKFIVLIVIYSQASNGNDLSALQKRQTEIIKQLEQLRLKLNEMQKKLGANAPSAKTTQKKPATAVVIKPIDVSLETNKKCNKKNQNLNAKLPYKLQEKNLHDIVIHVNPVNIPYSFAALQILWTDRLNLLIECYTHSSVKELPAQNQVFVKRISSFKPNAQVPTLNVSLIWKQTATVDLVCAPGTFIPISGEPNILRYLIRIGPSEFGYLNSIHANLEIDALFDLAYELVLASAKDHRSSILKRLSQRLNTQRSFGGDSTNVSDIVVYSTLKQLNLPAKELPANVKTWFDQNKNLIQV